MSGLFSMAVVRNPKPAPPVRPDDPVVFTHPSASLIAGAGKIKSLHDVLYAAWQERDWHRLAALARRCRTAVMAQLSQ